MQAKADKAALLEEAARKADELAALPHAESAHWPEPVAQLVAEQTRAAAAEAAAAAGRDTEAALATATAERDAAVAARGDLEARTSALESERAAAQARADRLAAEMHEQESALRARVRTLESAAAATAAAGEPTDVDAGVVEARAAALETALAAAEARSAALQVELDAARAHAIQQLREAPAQSSSAPASELSVSELPARRASPAPPHAAPASFAGSASEADAPPGAPSRNGAGGGDAVQYWKGCYSEARERIAGLEADVAAARAAVREERHAHALRDLADGAKQSEIAELRAQTGRSSVDVEYLKNALLGFFESGELPANAQVLAVLERLLCFTARDRARLSGVRRRAAAAPSPSKARSAFGLFG